MSDTRRKQDQEREETIIRYAKLKPLVDKVRSGLDILDDFRREQDLDECKRIAGLLEPELREYLFQEKIDIPDLSQRAWAAADYITDILPRSIPATPQSPPPAPIPRPAARTERPRIVLQIPPAEPPQPAEVICAGYILMPQTSTYALGVQALRQACEQEQNADPRHRFVRPDGSWIYRPLMFKETIQARVESYQQSTLEDRLKLFDRWEDSCTGAAYKAGTTKFKLIPQCEHLITIPADFNQTFLSVPYNTWDVPELDSAAPRAKFNQQLTPNEVGENEGWRAAVENDLTLLRTYRDIVWDAYTQRYGQGNRPERLMGFYVGQNTPTDELRAWFVHDLSSNSGANGRDILDDGSFLRVAP